MQRTIIGGVLSLSTLLQGCKADAPSKAEIAVMTKAKHSIIVGDRNMRNPLNASNQNVADGKIAFTHYCVVCHGMDGQNTGVPFSGRMNPPVPSLASRDVQSYTDGQLKWVIENGIAPSGMPGAKGILSDNEQWEIVVFLRHLPPAGSLGEPGIYGN